MGGIHSKILFTKCPRIGTCFLLEPTPKTQPDSRLDPQILPICSSEPPGVRIGFGVLSGYMSCDPRYIHYRAPPPKRSKLRQLSVKNPPAATYLLPLGIPHSPSSLLAGVTTPHPETGLVLTLLFLLFRQPGQAFCF